MMPSKRSLDIRVIDDALKTAKRRYDSAFRKSEAIKTREQFVQATRRLLRDRTREEITLADVARDAGAGLRTLFRHFPTRQALLREVSASAPETLPAENLRGLIRGICEHHESLGTLASDARISDQVIDQLSQLLRTGRMDQTLLAVTVMLSPQTWHLLRRQHALSAERALSCIESAVQQLTGQSLGSLVVQPQTVEDEEFID